MQYTSSLAFAKNKLYGILGDEKTSPVISDRHLRRLPEGRSAPSKRPLQQYGPPAKVQRKILGLV
jgi:hypothetical protein